MFGKGAINQFRPSDLISRVVEDDYIEFGKAVFQGHYDYGCTSVGLKFVGITVCDFETTQSGFFRYEQARLAVQGVINVEPEDDVDVGDPVCYTPSGNFSNTGTRIKGARFERTSIAGQVVPIYLHGVATDTFYKSCQEMRQAFGCLEDFVDDDAPEVLR